jgi:hypothetical protein
LLQLQSEWLEFVTGVNVLLKGVVDDE